VIAVHSVGNMKHISAHCECNVDLLNVKAHGPLYVPFGLTLESVCVAHRMYLCILCNAETVGNYFLV
jgi:hypothetical protein